MQCIFIHVLSVFSQTIPSFFLPSYCLFQNWVVRKGKNKPKDLLQHTGAFLARPCCTVRLISCLLFLLLLLFLFFIVACLFLRNIWNTGPYVCWELSLVTLETGVTKFLLHTVHMRVCSSVLACVCPIMLLVFFPILWFLDLFNLLLYYTHLLLVVISRIGDFTTMIDKPTSQSISFCRVISRRTQRTNPVTKKVKKWVFFWQ